MKKNVHVNIMIECMVYLFQNDVSNDMQNLHVFFFGILIMTCKKET